MDQPLDFSKSASTIKSMSFAATKNSVQRFNTTSKSIKPFTTEYHSHNSENSDENMSRSSASSPDSMIGVNEQAALNLNSGHSTLSQQALLMLAVASNQNLAAMNFNAQQLINSSGDLRKNFISQFNTMTAQPTAGQTSNVASSNTFLMNSTNLNDSAAHAAAACVSNMMNQQIQNTTNQQQFNSPHQSDQYNQSNKPKSNQIKSSSKSTNKLASRKSSSTIAKQDGNDKKSNQSSAIKFGVLSDSQNANILQIDADIEDSSSPSTNSLQLSINSNMSGEENSLYSEMFGVDDGSPRSQRRRGNPIPESLKDDSYWHRRRKNNEAAKKSRDAKRAKDLVTAKRAVQLENENSDLRSKLNQIQSENFILRKFIGEDSIFDESHKQQIDEIITTSRKVDPEKVRAFVREFFRAFGTPLKECQKMES